MNRERPPSRHPASRAPRRRGDGGAFAKGRGLGVWHLRLPAAPHPLVLRGGLPFNAPDAAGRAEASVADVVRYTAGARRTLKGPLALEIEGPGDPLASPETVLRSLSLLHEHHPDVVTGLVIDGPLLAEYVEELSSFGLGYLVVRMDGVDVATIRRLVRGAIYKADHLDREEAARLVVDETERALRVAATHELPVAVRFTLAPTVNGPMVGEVARRARTLGAARMDIVPYVPPPEEEVDEAHRAFARWSAPTAGELQRARRRAVRAFAGAGRVSTLDWLAPDRLQPVDVDLLEAVDVLRTLPDPTGGPPPARVLPPRRAQLVAVATREGDLVDTPLAAAHLLRIYAVTDDSIRYVGSRSLALDPRRRHDGVGDAQAFLGALVGCRAVVATHLTRRAATLLAAVGIHALCHR